MKERHNIFTKNLKTLNLYCSTLIFASNMRLLSHICYINLWVIHPSIHLGIYALPRTKVFSFTYICNCRNALVDASKWHTTWPPLQGKLSIHLIQYFFYLIFLTQQFQFQRPKCPFVIIWTKRRVYFSEGYIKLGSLSHGLELVFALQIKYQRFLKKWNIRGCQIIKVKTC